MTTHAPIHPDTHPRTCADCGGRLIRSEDGVIYRHADKGVEHAPRPVGTAA